MRINCGPRGIIITKSTATVNCTAASISSRSHSFNGRRSGSLCDGGSADFNWVGEECACVVKTATVNADQFRVKTLIPSDIFKCCTYGLWMSLGRQKPVSQLSLQL